MVTPESQQQRLGASDVCCVCGKTGDHNCSLSASTNAQQRKFLRFLGPSHWVAHIHSDSLTHDWTCRHNHNNADDALLCARQQLDQFQLGIEQIIEMPVAAIHGIVVSTSSVRATVRWLGPSAFRDLCEIYNFRCRFCGSYGPLERDHAVPLARGGENWAGNIIPVCSTCNQAKGVATEEEYLKLIRRTFGHLITRLPPNAKRKHLEWAEGFPREPRDVTLFREIGSPEVRARLARFGEVNRALLADFTQRGPQITSKHKVAGVTHYQAALRQVGGDWAGRAALVPQEENPHDTQAIQVWAQGRHIGYLPHEIAVRNHEMLVREARDGVVVGTRCHTFDTGHDLLSARVHFDDPISAISP